jgi:hypothetical protein
MLNAGYSSRVGCSRASFIQGATHISDWVRSTGIVLQVLLYKSRSAVLALKVWLKALCSEAIVIWHTFYFVGSLYHEEATPAIHWQAIQEE